MSQKYHKAPAYKPAHKARKSTTGGLRREWTFTGLPGLPVIPLRNGGIAERVTVTIRTAHRCNRTQFKQAIAKLGLQIATDENGDLQRVDSICPPSNRQMKKAHKSGEKCYPVLTSYTVWGLREMLDSLLSLESEYGGLLCESHTFSSATIPFTGSGQMPPLERASRPMSGHGLPTVGTGVSCSDPSYPNGRIGDMILDVEIAFAERQTAVLLAIDSLRELLRVW